MTRRVLLLISKQSYRKRDFEQAAEAVGAEVIRGTDRCHVLSEQGSIEDRGETLVLDFSNLPDSTKTVVEHFEAHPFDAVVAVDEPATELAAQVSKALGLVHNDLDGVRATRDKLELRRRLTEAGLHQARFVEVQFGIDNAALGELVQESVGFPCVVKPRSLSMSRGVLRADDERALCEAFVRVKAILEAPEVAGTEGARAGSLLIESFVDGTEIAIEGLLEEGELIPLAIFDKPDPMDGPTFEETLYVTPSRLDPELVDAAVEQVRRGARALGLVDGPVHAEARLSGDGPVLLEITPRSIGGLCSRTLEFGLGRSLERLILEHAFGLPTATDRKRGAAGVLMIPIPASGTLVDIRGLEEARTLPHITEVVMTKAVGEEIVALPEGHAYAGFAFARAESPSEVEAALRRLWGVLALEIRPRLPVFPPQTVDGAGPGL